MKKSKIIDMKVNIECSISLGVNKSQSGSFKYNQLGFSMSGNSSKNISQALTPYGGAITDALP